jgi:hypothetical protein
MKKKQMTVPQTTVGHEISTFPLLNNLQIIIVAFSFSIGMKMEKLSVCSKSDYVVYCKFVLRGFCVNVDVQLNNELLGGLDGINYINVV